VLLEKREDHYIASNLSGFSGYACGRLHETEQNFEEKNELLYPCSADGYDTQHPSLSNEIRTHRLLVRVE
jgi:hypothetical protein